MVITGLAKDFTTCLLDNAVEDILVNRNMLDKDTFTVQRRWLGADKVGEEYTILPDAYTPAFAGSGIMEIKSVMLKYVGLEDFEAKSSQK